MRVLLVVEGGVHATDPRATTPALVDLIRALSGRVALRVLSLRQGAVPRSWWLHGVPVDDLGLAGQPTASWDAWRRVRSWGRDHGADVVHAMGLRGPATLAGAIARRWRVPLVATLWGGELVHLPDIGFGGGRFGRRVARWNARRADAVTTWTEGARRLTGVDAAIVPLMPNPLGVVRAPVPGRLLVVATLNRVKDPELMLAALTRLDRHITLDWAGVDTLGGAVQRRAVELGIADRVRFLGLLGRDALAAALGTAELVVQSSRYECQGVAIVEAFQAGVPVVGTAVGLVGELGPDVVTAVAPRDPAALADAIRGLLGDRARQQRQLDAARAWVAGRDAAWTADRLIEVWRSVQR